MKKDYNELSESNSSVKFWPEKIPVTTNFNRFEHDLLLENDSEDGLLFRDVLDKLDGKEIEKESKEEKVAKRIALYYGLGGEDKKLIGEFDNGKELAHFLIEHIPENQHHYAIALSNREFFWGLRHIEAIKIALNK